MAAYKFDWKDVVHGQIEIEAENGVEAERLFREMPLEQRLAASNVGVDKDTLDIKFVDVDLEIFKPLKSGKTLGRVLFEEFLMDWSMDLITLLCLLLVFI